MVPYTLPYSAERTFLTLSSFKSFSAGFLDGASLTWRLFCSLSPLSSLYLLLAPVSTLSSLLSFFFASVFFRRLPAPAAQQTPASSSLFVSDPSVGSFALSAGTVVPARVKVRETAAETRRTGRDAVGTLAALKEERQLSLNRDRSGPPPYGQRKGFVPRSEEDFGGGGAFPEILVAQFPLGMGKKKLSK
ncbi:putative transmembrane protein [Toxoplasma gondii TgCatPRC2]|uniref:Putative transmembrane protein n=1 Tax=Toxoplasma gondii TgCatPRC2 TaxID=1130821 RepID=A0A151H2E1_TOXGO|nr:putative transmembrane protein [Toxoplasma gondii TgCatPRC2]